MGWDLCKRIFRKLFSTNFWFRGRIQKFKLDLLGLVTFNIIVAFWYILMVSLMNIKDLYDQSYPWKRETQCQQQTSSINAVAQCVADYLALFPGQLLPSSEEEPANQDYLHWCLQWRDINDSIKMTFYNWFKEIFQYVWRRNILTSKLPFIPDVSFAR